LDKFIEQSGLSVVTVWRYVFGIRRYLNRSTGTNVCPRIHAAVTGARARAGATDSVASCGSGLRSARSTPKLSGYLAPVGRPFVTALRTFHRPQSTALNAYESCTKSN
jgi:hypothetical protein